MGTESERCVDELLLKQANIDELVAELDSNTNDSLLDKARDMISSTRLYIDNNRSSIPAYCLKKVTDSLKGLEARSDIAKKTGLKFKFKPVPKTLNQSPELISTSTKCFEVQKNPLVLPQFFGFQNNIEQKLSLGSTAVESKDVSLINLSKCFVEIKGLANTVYIRNLKDTSVTVWLACRAITITNCINCKFKLICQQLRIDATSACKFEIFTSARSMLESSNDLQFKCLDFNTLEGITLDETRELLSKAKFIETQNNWRSIDDFDSLSTTPSKNYCLIEN